MEHITRDATISAVAPTIPLEKIDAVTRALNKAFDVSTADQIQDLTERPTSNRAFRIVVQGSPYFLRINTRPGDTTRHFHCMRAAAEAGLAPRVYYTNAEDRISITDFVEPAPFPSIDALRRVPAALRSLHALPPFPTSPFNTTCTFLLAKGPMLDGLLEKIRALNNLPQPGLDELLARLEQLTAACSSFDADLVPSHNDLFKPDNMLFDGTGLWIVDWEAAFQNDRYADLAVAANMLVSNEAEEQIYLQEYFGAPPTLHQVTRFHLMQQLAHIFYAMAFLCLASPDEPIDWSEPVPAYDDFQRRFWSREFPLNDNHSKIVYGRVHLERALGGRSFGSATTS